MFDKAIKLILKWEAGYVNDPSDPGGETKYGISKRSYPNLDIKNLTEQQAKEIYKRDFWDTCKCNQLPYPVAIMVFDTAVNMGTGTAIKMLQKSINVNVDGIIGTETITKANAMEPAALLPIFCSLRTARYVTLDGWDRFGFGWTRRTFDVAIRAFK